MTERVEAPRAFGGRTQQRIGAATLVGALVAGLMFGSAIGSATMRPSADADDVTAIASGDPSAGPDATASIRPSPSPEPTVDFIAGAEAGTAWPEAIRRLLDGLDSADIVSASARPPAPGGRDWVLDLEVRGLAVARYPRIFEALADRFQELGFEGIRISRSSSGDDYRLEAEGLYAYVGGRFSLRDAIKVVIDRRAIAGDRFQSIYGPGLEVVLGPSFDCTARITVDPENAGQWPNPGRAPVVADAIDASAARPLVTAIAAALRGALVGQPAEWGMCGNPGSYLDTAPVLRLDGLYLTARYDDIAAVSVDTTGTILKTLMDALRARDLSPTVRVVDAGFAIEVAGHPDIDLRVVRRLTSIDYRDSGWVVVLFVPSDALPG